MEKLNKKEEWEIRKEFLGVEQVKKLVKQWIIEALDYITCPNCWSEYLEQEWCMECWYWKLNNSTNKLPEIKKGVVVEPSIIHSTPLVIEKKWKEIQIEHNGETIILKDYKKSKKGVDYIIFERGWIKYRIVISEIKINDNKIDSFKFRIETKRWNKYKYDFVTKDNFWKIKNITKKFLKELLIKN